MNTIYCPTSLMSTGVITIAFVVVMSVEIKLMEQYTVFICKRWEIW
jgi:hypothetical protein